MVAASEYAVLNVVREKDQLKVILSALQSLNSDLTIKSNGNVIKQESILLNPLDLSTTTLNLNENLDFLMIANGFCSLR